jgi:hypothetical protein
VQVVSIAGFSASGSFKSWAVGGTDQLDPHPKELDASSAVSQASSSLLVVELSPTSITIVEMDAST